MQEHPLVQQGTRIGGRYEIACAIGRGGVGCVFEARHVELSKSFALKLIRLDHWSDNALRRFRREAQALARIDSPRVVQVTDFGVDDTVGPYLVMEYLRRQTLRDYLEKTPRPALSVVKTLIEQAGEALADIHDAGLLHRDIKPSNIAIALDQPVAVKLIDLGLAIDHGPHAASRVTASHEMVGSMPYMAPELFSGGGESVASDCWSLGVVLAEMLRGAPPFDAPSTAALIHQITTSTLPDLPSSTPPEMSAVLQALLERDPQARTRSARRLFSSGVSSDLSVRPTHASGRNTRWVVPAALAAVGLCAGAWVALSSEHSTDAPTEAEFITAVGSPAQAPQRDAPLVAKEVDSPSEAPTAANEPAGDAAEAAPTPPSPARAASKPGERPARRTRTSAKPHESEEGTTSTKPPSRTPETSSDTRDQKPVPSSAPESAKDPKQNWYGEVIDEF